MSNYINQVSDSLKNHISELANNPCLFLRNPNVDFSRKRKIDFKTFIGIMMNSGGATMSKELCIWRILTAGFAEQNGRNAKLNGRITFDY